MTLSLDRSAWQKMKFAEFAENVNDRVDDPKSAGVSRYVGLEHLDPGSFTVSRWGSPDQVEATKLRFKPGDVIFGRRRAYQKKVSRADFEGICSAHAMVLRARPGVVDPDFLPVFLSSDYFLDRAIKISVGSLSPTVNWKALAVQEFELPPLDQQRRIAELLWLSEEDRMRARDVIEACRALGGAIYRSTPGGRLVTVRDVVERIEAGKSPLAREVPAEATDFGVLKVSAVSSGAFEPEENKTLLEPSDFVPEVTVRGGDLLVSRANAMVSNVGVACLVDRDYPNLMLSDKTLRLVPRNGHSRRVLLEALRDAGFRKHVEGSAGGTGAKNISQQGILRGPCRVLDTDVEAALEERLLEADDGVRLSLLLAEQVERRHHALLTELLGGAL